MRSCAKLCGGLAPRPAPNDVECEDVVRQLERRLALSWLFIAGRCGSPSGRTLTPRRIVKTTQPHGQNQEARNYGSDWQPHSRVFAVDPPSTFPACDDFTGSFWFVFLFKPETGFPTSASMPDWSKWASKHFSRVFHTSISRRVIVARREQSFFSWPWPCSEGGPPFWGGPV